MKIEGKAQKEYKKLNPSVKNLIKNYLEIKIVDCENPRIYGKPLTGGLSGYWRYRVGEYRLISIIEDDSNTVKILRVAHRREVY